MNNLPPGAKRAYAGMELFSNYLFWNVFTILAEPIESRVSIDGPLVLSQ
jgi:hypothetical protein